MLDSENIDEDNTSSPPPPPESEHDVWADDSLLGDVPTRRNANPPGGATTESPSKGDCAPLGDLLGDDSAFEPATIFDASGHDAAPPMPRELTIAPESSGYVPEIGDVLNERFELVKLIAVGSLGLVYLVQDLRLKDKKALKLMHPRLMKNPFHC